MNVLIKRWEQIDRRNQIAFIDVILPDYNLQLNDVRVHQNEERLWANLPARRVLVGNGSIIWRPHFSFDDDEKNAALVQGIERAVKDRLEEGTDE